MASVIIKQIQSHTWRIVLPACLVRRHATSSIDESYTPVTPSKGGPPSLLLNQHCPVYGIWGANTCVGKTVVSAALAAAATRNHMQLGYLKPVQTGFPTDSDARLVADVSQSKLLVGEHASQCDEKSLQSGNDHNRIQHAGTSNTAGTGLCKVMYAWRTAVSPHLAVQQEGRPVSDSEVAASTAQEANALLRSLTPGQQGLLLVETAGGVLSPGPSGALQADIMRPLRLPAILVGDHRLGGISATISAYESLLVRGYQVDAVVLMRSESGLDNHAALASHFRNCMHRLDGQDVEIVDVPYCPPPDPSLPILLGTADLNLSTWIQQSALEFDRLLKLLARSHQQRLERLQGAAEAAKKQLWWPFTQHTTVNTVQVIDARAGEHWQLYQEQSGGRESQLAANYDAAASWWTQSVSAELQPEVVRAMAHAAGRYMHVLFPENTHEGAAELARLLLESVGAGWASRVFYSDDGSTAVEVALKMALRKYSKDHRVEPGTKLEVLGLSNSYHGDTLGAMDCSGSSPFNAWKQAPWYSGRGVFLDPPSVGLTKGEWVITLPEELRERLGGRGLNGAALGRLGSFEKKDDVFATSRESSELAAEYEAVITAAIEEREKGGAKVAACIMEPLLMGSAGMVMVDPLFQRLMYKVAKAKGIPVILDEVFTGLYRVGSLTAAALVGLPEPDIACYAKILSAGAVPMAVTLTTEDVFKAFEGSSKLDALLHGHSYTAHPIGCAAALAAFRLLNTPSSNPNLCHPSDPSSPTNSASCCNNNTPCTTACGRLLPIWDNHSVLEISHHPLVQRVVPLGTVLAVEISTAKGDKGGYGSGGALEVVQALRQQGVFARPLGNVVYMMVTPTTKKLQRQELMEAMKNALDQGYRYRGKLQVGEFGP